MGVLAAAEAQATTGRGVSANPRIQTPDPDPIGGCMFSEFDAPPACPIGRIDSADESRVAPCLQGATRCSVSRANRMSGAFPRVAPRWRPSKTRPGPCCWNLFARVVPNTYLRR